MERNASSLTNSADRPVAQDSAEDFDPSQCSPSQRTQSLQNCFCTDQCMRGRDAESAEDVDPIVCRMRSAIQAELEDICAVGGSMRRAMRSEVEAALKSCGGQLATRTGSPRPTSDHGDPPVGAHHGARQELPGAAGRSAGPAGPGEHQAACSGGPEDRPVVAHHGAHQEAPEAAGSSAGPGGPEEHWAACSGGPEEGVVVPVPRGDSQETLEPRRRSSRKRKSLIRDSALSKSMKDMMDDYCMLERSPFNRDGVWSKTVCGHSMDSWRIWWGSLEEPESKRRFDRFVAGPYFEAIVCLVIFINCAVTIHETNHQIQNPSDSDPLFLNCIAETSSSCTFYFANLIFQALYTGELIMRLVVHGRWFFCNRSWKTNIFELGLVLAGFVYVILGSKKGPWILRMLRLARLGQGIRFVRILSHMEHLRALLICIQGSLSSLFWSLLMVAIVHVIFALFIMQSISAYLQGRGESLEESMFYESFGSVGASVLTLYMASTGGEDWGVAYGVIRSTGKFGSAMFLFFLAFVQFALINIITGIFVDTAVKTLMKDSELLAREHLRLEKQHAEKLTQLCKDAIADPDSDGKMSPTEFKNVLDSNVLTVLTMLGFQRHNVEEVFNRLADDAVEKEVDIREFVKNCMVMKGNATSFDLHKLYAKMEASQVKLGEDLMDIRELLHDIRAPSRNTQLHEILRNPKNPAFGDKGNGKIRL